MSSERAAEVMKMMVTMFSTGDVFSVEETVHPTTWIIKAFRVSPSTGLPVSRRSSLLRDRALTLST